MSFYKSLSQLTLKIEQKNIVFVSGNINEIIDTSSNSYDDLFPLLDKHDDKKIINLIEHLCQQFKALDYKSIKYFSPQKGIIDFLDKKNNIKNITKNDDDFLEEDLSSNIDAFIDYIKDEIDSIDDLNYLGKRIYMIDYADVLLEKQSNIAAIKLASLIEMFTNLENQDIKTLHKNKIKLVVISRNQEFINQLIFKNNVEYVSIKLLLPNKEERCEFYKKYKTRFDCLLESCKDIDHQDFRDVITYSDGLSFRELFQYSKIDKNSNVFLEQKNVSFKELYKLINFNKNESEWEKIDIDKIEKIYEILSKRVKGQEEAINIVKSTLIRSFVGMNGVLHSSLNNRKPKGVLFFVGPTGTGKTELAKSISEFIFGEETRIIRFDMSEFSQEHSDQRLIGAPPGYVGYDVGGELTESVKQKPFSILLFDEIEKAHPRILDKFLQILEDGRLTSSQGENVDFSETFIIFTSNIGAKNIDSISDIKNNKIVHKHFIESVSTFFKEQIGRPELLNRIGYKNIVSFNFIFDKNIAKNIIYSKLISLEKMLLKEKNIEINFKNNAIDLIVDKVFSKYDNKMGGRGLIIELETIFIDEISNFIFQNYKKILSNIKENKITHIDCFFVNEQLNFLIT